MKVTVVVLKVALSALIVAVPLLGIWVGSSLSAYAGASVVWAIVAGLVAFPLGPLLWDALSQFRRRKDERPRILTRWDRILVRTLVINVVFLTSLLLFGPQTLFTALATRGDWMLDDSDAEWADDVRSGLFATADRIEWLYDSFDEGNEFEALIESGDQPTPEPPSVSDSENAEHGDDTGISANNSGNGDSNDGVSTGAAAPTEWPFPDTPHPAAAQIPASAETNYASAARWLASQEDVPRKRAKLLHDYIALRTAYDGVSYRAGRYPPQDAETVFRTRLSVCAGYANLFHAMAREMDLESAVVVGDTRKQDGDISGEGHAWNAVRIEGKWYLVDVTWDSGHLRGTEFVPNYRTDYFLTPPDVIGLDHLPDAPEWQLRSEPIGRGEFARQPLLRPGFFRHGFDLRSPRRSQVSVGDELEIQIANPRGHFLLVDFRPKDGGTSTRCEVSQGAALRATCEFPASGIYRVVLFASAEQYGSQYHGVGSIQAVVE
ncbi:MAG: transglutaminase domain-containing protein [Myxococcota bacterium]